LIASLSLVMAAGAASFGPSTWLAYWLAAVGGLGLAMTLGKCIDYGLRTDIDSLPRIGRHSRVVSRAWYRVAIAWLHLIQPLARMHGRVRGLLFQPRAYASTDSENGQRPRPVPSWPDAWRALRVLGGVQLEDSFWSESWIDAESLLARFTNRLRALHAVRLIEIDSGWSTEHDVSVGIGRWGRFTVLVLCEDHGGGKCLHRIASRLRLTVFGGVVAGTIGVALVGVGLRWPSVGAVAAGLCLGLVPFTVWRVARVMAGVRAAIAAVSTQAGMLPMAPAGSADAPGRRTDVPGRLRQARASLREKDPAPRSREETGEATSAASVR